ncbi:hypothetical protein [Gordonia metallireducens]|uniref:hypothetical protein n=1 Tax=Gordonia metallireducens TaxID=2897779 RepID=UPI001E5FAB83|nr:hypothetical protein [Gordonia metallireducens]
MTDTVFDSAVGPASAAAESPVESAVLDDVRSKLRLRGLDGDARVVLLGLDGNGCVSVGRFDTSRGTVADTYADAALSLGALDRAIADHLTRIGRVESPTSPEWQDELFDLISRGRERLQDSDGTFLMGRQHIRLFRMARRDVEEAGGALIARGEDLARAAVAGAQAHAVVITDGLGVWPGLRDGIAKAVPVPVVDAAPGPMTAPVPTGPLDGPRNESEPEVRASAPGDTAATDSPPTPVGEPAADAPAEAPVEAATAQPDDLEPGVSDTDAGADLAEPDERLPDATDDTKHADAEDGGSADPAEATATADSPDPAQPTPGDDDRVAVEPPASTDAEAAETTDRRGADTFDSKVEFAAEGETRAEPEPVVDDSPELSADEVTDQPATGVAGSAPDDAPTEKLSLPFAPHAGNHGRSGDFPVIGVERKLHSPVAQPVDPGPATAFGALTVHSGPTPVPETAPADVHMPDPVVSPHANAPAPESYSPVPQTGSTPAGSRRTAKRLMAGVALVCALAVIGVAVALAAGSNDSSPAPVAGPTTPATTAPTTQEYADPAIFAEARQPAQRYTPPPPPVTTNEPAPSPPRPRSRAPRPQRGVTIPNPIPGLPPIVLP